MDIRNDREHNIMYVIYYADRIYCTRVDISSVSLGLYDDIGFRFEDNTNSRIVLFYSPQRAFFIYVRIA